MQILQTKNGMFPFIQHTNITAGSDSQQEYTVKNVKLFHVLSSLNPTETTEMGKIHSKKAPETKVNRLNLQYSKVHH